MSTTLLIAIVVMLAWTVSSCALRGLRFSLGSTALLSMLVPSWLVLDLGGLPFYFRVIAGIGGLLLVCGLHRESFKYGLLPGGFGLADYSLFGLVGVHVAADLVAGSNIIIAALRAYGEWLIPYFLGRFSVLDVNDWRQLGPVVVGVSAALGGLAVVESTTRVNPFEVVVGDRPEELAPRHAERFGIKRAFGPTTHPIFLGVLLLLLLPMHALGLASPNSRLSLVLRAGALIVACCGALCTGSRVVILALLGGLWCGSLLAFPRWRTGLAIASVAGVLVGLVFFDRLARAADDATQESRKQLFNSVTIDGERLPHSGTLTRLYLFRLYQPALAQMGPLGYGTERLTGFPADVPFRAEDREAVELMSMIDNAYLLFLLRFGWLGVLFFTLTVGIFAAYGVCLATASRGRIAGQLYSWQAAVLLMVPLILLTVWFSHDFGFFFLWCGGCITSVWRMRNLHQYSAAAAGSGRQPPRLTHTTPKTELPQPA
jgi:hypothetical protein